MTFCALVLWGIAVFLHHNDTPGEKDFPPTGSSTVELIPWSHGKSTRIITRHLDEAVDTVRRSEQSRLHDKEEARREPSCFTQPATRKAGQVSLPGLACG
jgi:hypothetical protein